MLLLTDALALAAKDFVRLGGNRGESGVSTSLGSDFFLRRLNRRTSFDCISEIDCDLPQSFLIHTKNVSAGSTEDQSSVKRDVKAMAASVSKLTLSLLRF